MTAAEPTEPLPDWLADLQRQGQEMQQRSEQLQADMAELSESASSPDGSVQVTVGGNGALRDLQIGPQAMSKTGPQLAAEVMRLSATAQSAAAKRVMSMVEPLAGADAMEAMRSYLPPELEDEPEPEEPQQAKPPSPKPAAPLVESPKPATPPAEPKRKPTAAEEDDDGPPVDSVFE